MRPLHLFGVVLALAMPVGASPMFQGLGTLPSPFPQFATSSAEGVSSDGHVVVGQSQGFAFRWTAEGGMQPLGTSPGGAYGVSDDGSVVVGKSGSTASRWTSSTGLALLGNLPGGTSSIAYDVSGDGTVVVGAAGGSNQSFRWTQATGLVGLGTAAPGRAAGSTLYGISQDGQVLVGTTPIDPISGPDRATRWTTGGGYQVIPTFPSPYDSRANAASADGSVIVGQSGTLIVPEAFLWSADTGTISLGQPAGTTDPLFTSEALSVSADGRVVVGVANAIVGSTGTNRAFIWDAASGSRYLQDVLQGFGLDLTGWTLSRATDISADGLVIVGTGVNPAGNDEGWIAIIPEPSTGLLLIVGLFGLAGRRRLRA